MALRELKITQPRTLVFGRNCSKSMGVSLQSRGSRRVLVVCSPSTRKFADGIGVSGCEVELFSSVDREPTVSVFRQACAVARQFKPDAVIGLGGGSPLDAAKLVAALWNAEPDVTEVFGIGLLKTRTTALLCVPTTAGTGSEVSPNAILLDERDWSKRAVISPALVPDETYVDPLLTLTVPPAVTAATGIDALTHCLEAFANRNAHPAVDGWALQGLSLVSQNLEAAAKDGNNYEAREAVALGSLLGGMCLGPVNTAAVHALAYPLGGKYHVGHGLSIAVMLPHVLRFNLPAAPARYARVAQALGEPWQADDNKLSERALRRLEQLKEAVGLTQTLRDFGVTENDVPALSEEGAAVKRLLDNNPRPISVADASDIYWSAFGARSDSRIHC
jgi:alcohol dehydrogenase